MTDDPWIKVWLQGGPADDWTYWTLIEPDPLIHMLALPTKGQWFRLPAGDENDWPEAVAYERVPSVEQLDHERIYYPADGL